VFVNDVVDAQVIERLSHMGVELVALRCAGFNNVDLKAAKRFGVDLVRVPAVTTAVIFWGGMAFILWCCSIVRILLLNMPLH
jgi:D-lactate dehydrogenase